MMPEEVDELIRGLGDDAAEDWVFAARDAQLPPRGLSWCWLFLGGRGAGKSHSMSAAVHTAVRAGIKRIHFIAPTTTDFHDVKVEGKSGIFATAAVIHGRVGCRRGDGWNGQTAQCVCFSPARSRNRCAARNASFASSMRSGACATSKRGSTR
jgi:phage terminase large subunit-like protein